MSDTHFYSPDSHMITQANKNANSKQWYKDRIRDIQNRSGHHFNSGFGGVDEFTRKKVNFDLYNNIIDVKELSYVCEPYGANVGEMPAKLVNRDISSGKIKALLGIEMQMPFSYRVFAVNEEATTEKEEMEFGKIRDYVIDMIMSPIRQEIIQQKQEQIKGRQLTPQEIQDLQAEIASEIEAKTPDKVRRYMAREHQSPAEVQANHIIKYLMQQQNLKHKFSQGWKHACLAGEEVYFITIENRKPVLKVVNTKRFTYDPSDVHDFIEDRDWAMYEEWITPNEAVARHGADLTKAEIRRLYEAIGEGTGNGVAMSDATFNFADDDGIPPYTIRSVHICFKSLQKVGFLMYFSEATGKPEMTLVDENYQFDRMNGDIHIEWKWIPQSHEGTLLHDDIYVKCRPVPGQNKDLYNLYDCKLNYYGVAYDNLNSPVTAPMDRVKSYQYFYDVIMYRIELLMASDKGKMIAMAYDAVPDAEGMGLQEMFYYMDANKIAFFKRGEEGDKNQQQLSANQLIQAVDMSLVSDIMKYIELARFVKAEAGAAIGVTPQMEAQIAQGEAVRNTQQNLIQAGNIVRPYFELHNTVKGRAVEALINTARVAYADSDDETLSYVNDDMSLEVFKIDTKLLEISRYGLFVANSSDGYDAKQLIINLSQAAMQNQQATLKDVIKVTRTESTREAEEVLEAAEDKAAIVSAKAEEAKAAHAERLIKMQEEAKAGERAHEIRKIIVAEEEKRKTATHVQLIESTGFDPNKDQDNDGQPDVLEVAKFGVDAEIKRDKQTLDREKFEHQKGVDKQKLENDKKKLENEDKKLQIQKSKPASK